MAPKKGAKKESSSTTTHQPAIVTRTSPRIAKPKLDSDSDPQPLPINVSSGSGKAKLDSVPKPPKSKKAGGGGGAGESSSMGSKKKVDRETAAIVTQRSTRQRGKGKVDSNVPIDSVSQPPKSKKAETNTSDGGGGESSSVASKKKANEESAAIVTQRCTRQSVKGKLGSNLPPDSSSATPTPTRNSNHRGKETLKSPLAIGGKPKKPPKRTKLESKLPSASTPPSDSERTKTNSDEGNAASKKRANMEPSSSSARSDKGKGKLELSERSTSSSEEMENDQNSRAIAKAIKENSFPHMFKPVNLTISEVNAVLTKAPPPKEREVVQPTSGVLTRRAKAQMGSDPTPPANPQPPKFKTAKATASTSGSIRRGKAKMGSNPTPPADSEPPKAKKAKATASTSGSTHRGKAKMGSDPTPPKGTTRGNSSVSATPKNKRTVEPSSRVLRSAKKD